MREITRLPAGELEHKAERDEGRIERLLGDAIKRSGRKIVVLDDDPTGVQTVHDVSVYTDWSEESVLQGFQEEGNLFYILTNSCLLYTSPSPRDTERSRVAESA